MRPLAFVLAATLCSAPVFAAEPDEIAPPHVYQAVRQVAQDVELIREVMGKPRLEVPGLGGRPRGASARFLPGADAVPASGPSGAANDR